MSDYEDYENLAFEPEFTWEDLVEWVEDVFSGRCLLSSNIFGSKFYINRLFVFEDIGVIRLYDSDRIIAGHRTPRQMQTIIKALYE